MVSSLPGTIISPALHDQYSPARTWYMYNGNDLVILMSFVLWRKFSWLFAAGHGQKYTYYTCTYKDGMCLCGHRYEMFLYFSIIILNYLTYLYGLSACIWSADDRISILPSGSTHISTVRQVTESLGGVASTTPPVSIITMYKVQNSTVLQCLVPWLTINSASVYNSILHR